MPSSARTALAALLLIGLPLCALGALGLLVGLQHLEAGRQAASSETHRAVAALVAETQQALRREALLLAQDPAIVEGAARGDWGVLARGTSPRLAALTRERFADLLVVVDRQGAMLVRAPASLAVTVADLPPPPEEPGGGLRVVAGGAYFLGVAPIPSRPGPPGAPATGTVVVGRRVESLAAPLAALPSRPGLLFLAGDRVLGSTIAATPDGGWGRALGSGAVSIAAGTFAPRRLGQTEEGQLWALISEADHRRGLRTLWIGVIGFLALAVPAAGLGGWVMSQRSAAPPPGHRDETAARVRRLEALSEIQRRISEQLDLEQLLELIARFSARLIGGTSSTVYLLEGDLLRPRAWHATEDWIREVAIPLGSGVAGTAVAERRGLIVNDYPRSPLALPPFDRIIERTLAQPLLAGERPLGVLLVNRDAGMEPFVEDDLAALGDFSVQASVAIENARLFNDAKVFADRLQALHEINRAVSGSLDLPTVLGTLTRTTADFFRVPLASVWVADEAGRILVRRAVAGETGLAAHLPERIAYGEGLIGRIADRRAAVVSAGVAAEDATAYRDWALANGLPAFTGIPLIFADRLLGVLVLNARSVEPLGNGDVAMLQAVAAQAAIAVEDARLFAEAELSAAQYRALFEVGRLVGSTLDVERVLAVIVEQSITVMGVRGAGIFRMDEDSGVLVYSRGKGLSPEFIQTLRVRVGEGTAGRAIREQRPVWSHDILSDPAVSLTAETRALVTREGYRGVLAVPILIKGEPSGILSVYWWEPHTPTPAEVGLLTALASQAAVALENAQLYEAATNRGRRLAALAALTETLTATLGLEDVLARIVRSAVGLFGSSVSRLWLVDEDGQTLTLRASAGMSAGIEGATRLRIGEGLVGWIVSTGSPLVVPDLAADPRVWNLERVRAEGTVSFAGAPLVVGDRVVGALTIELRKAHAFSQEELDLLQSLANHAAIAIENARLFAEERSRKAYLTALLEVNKSIGALAPTETLLTFIAEEAARLLGVDNAGFRLLDGDDLVVAGLAGTARETMLRPRIKVGESLSGKVVAEGRTLVCEIGSLPAVIPEHLAADRRLGYTMFLGVPLRVAGRATGVLTFRARRPFSARDVEVAEAFAGQAAVALEHARLYREAAEQARRMRALADLGRVLVSTFEVDRILAILSAQACEALDISHAGICLEDPETGLLRFIRGPGFSEAFVEAHTLEPGEGLAGRAVAEGRPVWTASLLEDPAVVFRPASRSRLEPEGTRAALAVPLVRERPFGALLVYREPGHRFTAQEIEYVSTLASQVAVAIENARLYAETHRRLEQTRALLEVAEILNSTLEPVRLLKQAAIKIARACQVDRCSIERFEGDRVIPLMSQFADGRREPALWSAFTAAGPLSAREVPAYARAMATRRPVVIQDAASTDLIPRQWVETFGHRAWMTAPLVRQDRVIGALSLDYCDRPATFAPWQVELATAIAGQLALSLTNARLYAEAQERLHETTTLLAVGQALSQPGAPEEVMRRAAREICRAFGADTVGIYVLDERREALVPLAAYRVPKHLLELFVRRPFVLSRFPMLIDAWRQGQAAWSADVKNDPRLDRETFAEADPHSALFVPTRVRGEAVGILFLVWWRTGREFPPGEVRLLEGVAAQVGLAMENADLVRRTQVRLRETETLLAVSRTLSSTLDLEALPRELLRHVVDALGADSAGIWMLEDDGEWLAPLAGYPVRPEQLDALPGLRISIVEHAFYGEAARGRRSVVSTNAPEDPRIPQVVRDIVPHQTQLFVPIVAKDRFVGGVAVVWWEARRELSEGELRLMEAIGSQAGVALENARLFRDNRRQVEELAVLYELSRAVTGQLDRAQLVQAVREQVSRVLDARHMVAFLYDSDRDELEVVLRIRDGQPDSQPPLRYPSRSVGLMSVVLESGRPLRTDDYAGECARRGVSPVPTSARLRNWLGVPMAAGDQVIGVLALRSEARPFTEADERLLVNIGGLAALALRSARLFEERTRAYGQLAAAQDELVRTEKLRALGEMASGVAHDFNNLLASIVGRAQLLLQRLEDPRLRRWVEVIERAGLDGARTVRRLQEFTRVRRDHAPTVVDLNRVVRESLEVTEPQWRDEPRRRSVTIEVVTRLSPGLAPVSGDPAELREAMTNLILNALDAMAAGGTLTLETAMAGDRVEVTVADTGIGMSESVRERIFDPFFTTKGPQGTGLGLSMTYGILSRHGARVAVESQEGRGTVFTLSFPQSTLSAPGDASPGPVPPPAGSLRCLVVDDEDPVAEVLGDMLAAGGHMVTVVSDGAEAIARFRAAPFDLVLTDLAMPGLTGWDVARAIKAIRPEVPVFLVTGFGVEVSAEELQANGVDAVLPKPLQVAEVNAVVARAWSERDPAGGEDPA